MDASAKLVKLRLVVRVLEPVEVLMHPPAQAASVRGSELDVEDVGAFAGNLAVERSRTEQLVVVALVHPVQLAGSGRDNRLALTDDLVLPSGRRK